MQCSSTECQSARVVFPPSCMLLLSGFPMSSQHRRPRPTVLSESTEQNNRAASPSAAATALPRLYPQCLGERTSHRAAACLLRRRLLRLLKRDERRFGLFTSLGSTPQRPPQQRLLRPPWYRLGRMSPVPPAFVERENTRVQSHQQAVRLSEGSVHQAAGPLRDHDSEGGLAPHCRHATRH